MGSHATTDMVAPEVAAEVFANPDMLGTLPRPALVDLRRQLSRLVADADALLATLPTATAEAPPKVLTMEEATLFLRCSRDSLYRKRHALRLGFVDPLDGRLKFTEAELRAHLARQARHS